MPRNVFQTLTIIALVAATVFVAHNFVRYILRGKSFRFPFRDYYDYCLQSHVHDQ